MKKIFKRSSPTTKQKASKKLDVSRIPHLISRQDWRALRYMFANIKPAMSAYICVEDNAQDDDAPPKETIMHLCCRFYPPLDILFGLYECNPKALFTADQWGQFPLHTACRCGASFDIIALFLMKESKDLLTAQDKIGKTPLHLMCEYFMQSYDPMLGDADGISPQDAMLEIIQRMYAASTSIVNIEDDEGSTALEIAIECGAPLTVVKKLQKASERDWKARRFGQESHEQMRNQFQKQLSSKREMLEEDTSALLQQAVLALSMSDKQVDDSSEEHPASTDAPTKSASSSKHHFLSLSMLLRGSNKQNTTRAHAA
jgi:ankyrin repeat protein